MTEPNLPSSYPFVSLRDYELMDELGRGGMGVVYRARQVSLNRIVAVKMIREERAADSQTTARFLREANAIAQLDHPGIVSIYDVGVDEDRYFFSMQFVAGESLASQLQAGPLDPRVAAELVRQTALAIDYAHQQGVIHRDLKPANVLLDPRSQIRVTDFGLAKQIDVDQTQSLTIGFVGTVEYCSPEQAGSGEPVGKLTDVYSLGAMLYALLVGRPPFQSYSPAITLRMVVQERVVPLRAIRTDLPRDLETICLTCLEKLPQDRYPSAEAMAADLQRFLDGKPIMAKRPGLVRRARMFLRRHPAWGVTLSVIGLAGVLLILIRLDQLADRKRAESDRIAQSNALPQSLSLTDRLGRSVLEGFPPPDTGNDPACDYARGLILAQRKDERRAIEHLQRAVSAWRDRGNVDDVAALFLCDLAMIHTSRQLRGADALAILHVAEQDLQSLFDRSDAAGIRADVVQALVVVCVELTATYTREPSPDDAYDLRDHYRNESLRWSAILRSTDDADADTESLPLDLLHMASDWNGGASQPELEFVQRVRAVAERVQIARPDVANLDRECEILIAESPEDGLGDELCRLSFQAVCQHWRAALVSTHGSTDGDAMVRAGEFLCDAIQRQLQASDDAQNRRVCHDRVVAHVRLLAEVCEHKFTVEQSDRMSRTLQTMQWPYRPYLQLRIAASCALNQDDICRGMLERLLRAMEESRS